MKLSETVLILCTVVDIVLNAGHKRTSRENFFIQNEKCYEEVGCFKNDDDFFHLLTRPIRLFPESRQKINMRYYLFTRKNRNSSIELKLHNNEVLHSSNFNGMKPTKMITHGFLENAHLPWVMNMSKQLLLAGDYNVIHVDWSGGNQLPYTQATANARLVGAEVALLIKYLERNANASRKDFHFIGHSLGAHVAGYTGERLMGELGRITGLDPAGPYFENTKPKVRLDPTDALFVDVIHTDGKSLLNAAVLNGGLGLFQPVGHVDFYPNGGKKQIGCSTNPIKNLFSSHGMDLACDHLRVLALYIDTIKANIECQFIAFRCDTYENFKAGKCFTCKNNGCAFMGLAANNWKHENRTHVQMFLDTTEKAPYCVHPYIITIFTGSVANQEQMVHGNMYITLHGSNGSSNEIAFFDKKSKINPLTSYQNEFNQSKNIGKVSKITFRWKYSRSPIDIRSLFYSQRSITLSLRNVTIVHGYDEMTTTFCGNNTSVRSDTKTVIYNTDHC